MEAIVLDAPGPPEALHIRTLPIPDLSRCFDEDVKGTAMTHLDRGLYEAHARDEAGFEDEGGHKDMWFAARDIAFEKPTAKIDVEAMLARGLLPVVPAQGSVGASGDLAPLAHMVSVLIGYEEAEAYSDDSLLVEGEVGIGLLLRLDDKLSARESEDARSRRSTLPPLPPKL